MMVFVLVTVGQHFRRKQQSSFMVTLVTLCLMDDFNSLFMNHMLYENDWTSMTTEPKVLTIGIAFISWWEPEIHLIKKNKDVSCYSIPCQHQIITTTYVEILHVCVDVSIHLCYVVQFLVTLTIHELLSRAQSFYDVTPINTEEFTRKNKKRGKVKRNKKPKDQFKCSPSQI